MLKLITPEAESTYIRGKSKRGKTMSVRLTLLSLLTALFFMDLQGQSLYHSIDSTKGTYIKANIRGQFWLRYTEMNPGTTINGEPTAGFFDISARRLRAAIAAQVTPKLYFYAGFGGNNLNHLKVATFAPKVLDLYAEYKFSRYLEVGLGKSAWQGVSRWNTRSTYSLMSMDAPLFVLSTVNRLDDLARNLGVWAKGQAGKLDYRLVVNSPKSYNGAGPEPFADFASNRPRLRTSGYLKYMFWDRESNKSAFSTGTFLGKKRILNVGIGALQQPNAMWHRSGQDTVYEAMSHWAVDVFLDMPIGKGGSAFTSYAGYFNYDFGKDYTRNLGANNPANGLEGVGSFNGVGNAFPMIGTGSTLFLQSGFLLPHEKDTRVLFQPYVALQYADLDRLSDPMFVQDLGLNIFFNGHDQKLTINYQNRPVYFEEDSSIGLLKHAAMVVMQYQVKID
jgi:hypothetical protein